MNDRESARTRVLEELRQRLDEQRSVPPIAELPPDPDAPLQDGAERAPLTVAPERWRVMLEDLRARQELPVGVPPGLALGRARAALLRAGQRFQRHQVEFNRRAVQALELLVDEIERARAEIGAMPGELVRLRGEREERWAADEARLRNLRSEISARVSDAERGLEDLDARLADLASLAEQVRSDFTAHRQDLADRVAATDAHLGQALERFEARLREQDATLERHREALAAPLERAIQSAQALGRSAQEDVRALAARVDHELGAIGDRIGALDRAGRHAASDRGWEEFYAQLATEEYLQQNVEHHRELLEAIEEHGRRVAGDRAPSILEVGIGTGTMAIHLSRGRNLVFGVDRSPIIVEAAARASERLGGHARFWAMDAFDLSWLRPLAFDVAFSQGLLEHFDDDAVIELLRRQLHAARRVLFSVPSSRWTRRDFGDERLLEASDWRAILTSAGLPLLELSTYHDDLHVLAVLGRDPQPASFAPDGSAGPAPHERGR